MYIKGEVVWAKIKGFPWWPAVVAKLVEDKDNPTPVIEVLVNFVGENSHAQLSLDKVAKYQENYEEYAKMKKKKLLESIESANRIFKGEATYQEEIDRIYLGTKEANAESRPKSQAINNPAARKKKNSKTFDDTESIELETESGQFESDHSDVDVDQKSQSDKERKKVKTSGAKGPVRKQSFSKTSNATSNSNKSPLLNKTGKTGGNRRRLIDDDPLDLDEPKTTKAQKSDRNLDEEQKSDTKLPEEPLDSTNKPQPSLKVPILPTMELANKANSFNTNNNAETSTQTSPVNAVSPKNQKITPLILNNKDFDNIYNLLIDKIANYETSTVSPATIESSIENVISKIYPETITIDEILDNDLGKRMYTLIMLLDELSDSVPEASGMNMEFEFALTKDKLIKYLDIIKDKLMQHYVESNDYCTLWLKKLATKRSGNPSSRKDRKVVQKPPSKTTKQLVEESKQEGSHPNGLAMNFEEFRFDTDKKKDNNSNTMVTTSTKVSKLVYNPSSDMKKIENKAKDIVVNAPLRKKICVKMCKILQEKYKMEKEKAQELTIKIESKIRYEHPDMDAQYKEKVLIVLKLLKSSLLKLDELVSNTNLDFKNFKKVLEAYQKEHGDGQMDGNFGEVSPTSSKDVSRDFSMISGR